MAGAANSGDAIGIPFAVDLVFSATGMMGAAVDGALTDDAGGCLDRPEGAQGNCHALVYSGSDSANGWVGLYWLHGPDNWGVEPGAAIASGARHVSFVAASNDPDVEFTFFVGGIENSETGFADAFASDIETRLTEEYQRFEIGLENASYENGVLGGFGWSANTPEPFVLWLDDIRWE